MNIQLTRMHYLVAIAVGLLGLNAINYKSTPTKQSNSERVTATDNQKSAGILPAQSPTKKNNVLRQSIPDESMDIFAGFAEKKPAAVLTAIPKLSKLQVPSSPPPSIATQSTPVTEPTTVAPKAPRILGVIEKDGMLLLVADDSNGSTIATRGAAIGNGWMVSTLEKNQSTLVNAATGQTQVVDLRAIWAAK